jgi:hypothetical protein
MMGFNYVELNLSLAGKCVLINGDPALVGSAYMTEGDSAAIPVSLDCLSLVNVTIGGIERFCLLKILLVNGDQFEGRMVSTVQTRDRIGISWSPLNQAEIDLKAESYHEGMPYPFGDFHVR